LYAVDVLLSLGSDSVKVRVQFKVLTVYELF